MYLCIDILPNRIESILSCLSYILRCYSFHASVSGTGRGCRQPGTRLPGDVFCAASSPGIASDRLWPTLSRATTIRSRRIRTVSAGSSSARPWAARRRGNPSLLRQISESAGGLPDNPSRAEERVDKHIRQYKAQGEHGFPSAKLEMIRESLEAEFLFNERLKKH